MTRCRAVWSDLMGRHRCCLPADHDGSHAKSRHQPDPTPPQMPRRNPPMTYSQYTRRAS